MIGGSGFRSRAAGLAIGVLATLMIGATDALESTIARIRRLPAEQRSALEKAREQFDMRLGPAEQASLRELDRKLAGLADEERAHYDVTLRRFHNWLSGLPEEVRDGLLAKPPEQRMAEIRSLAAKYPVPSGRSPDWVEFGDLGGPSAFELAALARIWRELPATERKQVEELPLPRRTLRLLAMGRERKIPREIRPDDFDLPGWIAKAEARVSELRLNGPELRAGGAAEPGKEPGPLRKAILKEQVRPLVMHRFAINLYGLEHPPKAVEPERLARFLAEMPPWIRSTFNSDSDDAARRKLAMAYRALFPYPKEFQPGPVAATKQAKPAEKASVSPAQKAIPPNPAKTATPSTTPF